MADIIQRMFRKFHDHSYSTGDTDIAMYISSLFSLHIFIFSLQFFGEKMQRRTKVANNEHYIQGRISGAARYAVAYLWKY